MLFYIFLYLLPSNGYKMVTSYLILYAELIDARELKSLLGCTHVPIRVQPQHSHPSLQLAKRYVSD